MDKFEVREGGRYEFTLSATANGEPYEERAVYEGNPATDPDAKLISGRDLARGDNAIYMNSGTTIDTSKGTWTTIEFESDPL